MPPFSALLANILESFDDHPPLILPIDGFLLDFKRPVGEIALIKQLSQLQAVITEFNDPKADTKPTFQVL